MPPIISYAAGYKIPDELDELEVAARLAGGPINVVRARTVDLMVPAGPNSSSKPISARISSSPKARSGNPMARQSAGIHASWT